MAFDARHFRYELGRFASGVTVINAHYQGRAHGMIANSFVSISLDLPLVPVSLATALRCTASVPLHAAMA
jgi:flavin reductase (DIM6/NTAB) family NADH-FMN oxidoreductase RutF